MCKKNEEFMMAYVLPCGVGNTSIENANANEGLSLIGSVELESDKIEPPVHN